MHMSDIQSLGNSLLSIYRDSRIPFPRFSSLPASLSIWEPLSGVGVIAEVNQILEKIFETYGISPFTLSKRTEHSIYIWSWKHTSIQQSRLDLRNSSLLYASTTLLSSITSYIYTDCRTSDQSGNPLLVTNIWDVPSLNLALSNPKTVAVATASFAIAATHGLEGLLTVSVEREKYTDWWRF